MADFIDISEFSRRSGLSMSTIRRRIKDGSIPSWQPGGPGTRTMIPISSIPDRSNQPPVRSSVVPETMTAAHHSEHSDENTHAHKISGPAPRWLKGISR